MNSSLDVHFEKRVIHRRLERFVSGRGILCIYMTGTTTVRVQDGTIHIGKQVKRADETIAIAQESLARASLPLKDRIVIGAALFVLILEVCDALARLFSQPGLPRDAAWYQVAMLAFAAVLIAATASHLSPALRTCCSTRTFTLSAAAAFAAYASFGEALVSIALKWPGGTVFFALSVMFVGVALASGYMSRIRSVKHVESAVVPTHPEENTAAVPQAVAVSQRAPVAPDIRVAESAAVHEVKVASREPAMPEAVALDARVSEGEVMWLAACLCAHSHEQYERQIVDAAHERHIVLKHVDHFSHQGDTLHGLVEGRKVSVRPPDHDDRYPEVRALLAEGKKVLMVDQNKTTVGAVSLRV